MEPASLASCTGGGCFDLFELWARIQFDLLHFLVTPLQTNILSAGSGVVKTVFYGVKDNVPASSLVVELEEEGEKEAEVEVAD